MHRLNLAPRVPLLQGNGLPPVEFGLKPVGSMNLPWKRFMQLRLVF